MKTVQRKRWIEKLPVEEYSNLSKLDKENYLKFQNLSKLRVGKEKKIQKLKNEIIELKSEVSRLNEREEYFYLKVQYLHNYFGCRIDVVRQERKPKSLKNLPQNKISFKKKTHKGKLLKSSWVYNGKIVSSSLEKVKPIYFQSEDLLIQTLSTLTGKKIEYFNVVTIKSFLKKEYDSRNFHRIFLHGRRHLKIRVLNNHDSV
jgi:hypothetical protein